MKKFLFSVIAVFSLVLVVGCGKKSPIIGTWKGETNDGLKTTFVFEKGDKVSYENQYGIKSEGTYKVDGKKVTIKLKSWDQEKVYEFEVKDDKLDLTATDKYSPSYKGMEKK